MEQYATTINPQEIDQFSKIANQWWDEAGPFKQLHLMNPIRLRFIRDQLCEYFNRDPHLPQPLAGLRLLDIGCGGGILCEPLSRLGAIVTGIDASPKSIEIARIHAQKMELEIRYMQINMEDLAKSKETFDGVISLEVLEHTLNQKLFLKICSDLLSENGVFILSTINRTPKSYMGAIIMAEYVLGWIPKGTHDWHHFVKPSELVRMLECHNIKARKILGMTLNPLTQKWSLSKNININYIIVGTRQYIKN